MRNLILIFTVIFHTYTHAQTIVFESKVQAEYGATGAPVVEEASSKHIIDTSHKTIQFLCESCEHSGAIEAITNYSIKKMGGTQVRYMFDKGDYHFLVFASKVKNTIKVKNIQVFKDRHICFDFQ